jgi:uncharacterized RDD family membrane protein YckC
VSRRSASPPETGDLLNLPLDTDPGVEPSLQAQDLLPFDGSDPVGPKSEASEPRPERSPSVRIRDRFGAGLVDLAAIGGACAAAFAGAWGLGARPDAADSPAFLAFALSFSFLYTVLPLTFWGQTPGMAASGIVARSRESAPLTIRQCFMRWLGGLLTVAFLGLPSLLALTHSSLADRMSGSRIAAVLEA